MSILQFQRKIPTERGWYEWRKNSKSKIVLGRVWSSKGVWYFDIIYSRRIFSQVCSEIGGYFRGPMTYEFLDAHTERE
jgi:hypothetical protein